MGSAAFFVVFCLLRLFKSEFLGYLHRFKDVHIYMLHQHLCQYFVGHCPFCGKYFIYTSFPMIAQPPPRPVVRDLIVIILTGFCYFYLKMEVVND